MSIARPSPPLLSCPCFSAPRIVRNRRGFLKLGLLRQYPVLNQKSHQFADTISTTLHFGRSPLFAASDEVLCIANSRASLEIVELGYPWRTVSVRELCRYTPLTVWLHLLDNFVSSDERARNFKSQQNVAL